jgi:hypothetical protein
MAAHAESEGADGQSVFGGGDKGIDFFDGGP